MTKNTKPHGLARAACALGISLAVCAGAPTAALAEYMGFPDVNPTDWYADVVRWSTENHVINGANGLWDPTGVVSRGMAATILYNLSGDAAPAEGATFADAATFGWAADGIAWAQDEGVFGGYGGPYGDFGAWDTLTREQTAQVLYNMFGAGERPGALALDGFTDSRDVSPWARDAVAWAAHHKIMGQGGSISPQATCTRAEFVTMLMRATMLDDEQQPPVTDPDEGDDGDEGTNPGGGTTEPGGDEGEQPGAGDEGDDEQQPPVTDPDEGDDGDEGTNPGGSTTEPGDDDEKPQEPTGSYDLADGTWTLKGTADAEDGYYNNVAFYGTPASYALAGGSVEQTPTLYNADLKGDVASVTNDEGVSLRQGVDFDVTRTFNGSAGTITTTVTGKNGSTGTLKVTERLHRATALAYSYMYCNVGWGVNDPLTDFSDGRVHVLYRSVPDVTISDPWGLYNWSTQEADQAVKNETDERMYYTYVNDSRINGKTVGSLVCDWFDGDIKCPDAVLEEGKDAPLTGQPYFLPRSTVNDFTAYCTNPKCDYDNMHDFSDSETRLVCGCTSLYRNAFMANLENANNGTYVKPVYVVPINLTN